MQENFSVDRATTAVGAHGGSPRFFRIRGKKKQKLDVREKWCSHFLSSEKRSFLQCENLIEI